MSIKEEINSADSTKLELMIIEAKGTIQNVAWALDNLEQSSFTKKELYKLRLKANAVISAASKQLAELNTVVTDDGMTREDMRNMSQESAMCN
jgi:hypothetical protein